MEFEPSKKSGGSIYVVGSEVRDGVFEPTLLKDVK